LIETSGGLIEALERHVNALRETSKTTKQQIATAAEHGLGPNIMSPDLLKNYVPTLKCLESLAKRALKDIEEATID
jgi:hypothetical protein